MVVGVDVEGVFERDSLRRQGVGACDELSCPPPPAPPPPIPRPGTEIPAFPSLPKAPWLRYDGS